MSLSEMFPFTLNTSLSLSYVRLAGLVLFIGTFLTLTVVFARIHRRSKMLDSVPGYTSSHLMGPLVICYNVLQAVLARKTSKERSIWFFQALSGLIVIFRNEICKIWLGWQHLVFLTDPESIEDLLMNTKNLRRSQHYRFINSWSERGIIMSTNGAWKQRRKTLTPAFHFRILENSLHIFNEESKILVEKLQEKTRDEYLDIVKPYSLCTLDILTRTAMGLELKAQDNPDLPYLKALQKLIQVFTARLMRPWLWPNFMFKLSSLSVEYEESKQILRNISETILEVCKKKMLTEISNKDDMMQTRGNRRDKETFMEILLRLHLNDNCLTENDIIEEVATFMFAGQDTSSSALGWTTYLLGLNPDIQENVRKELDAIFGDDRQRPVTTDDLRDLKYMECVIKESLRLYSPAPLIARELDEDMTIKDHIVPEGTTCAIFPFMLHRNPQVYPNPEKFEPERFLPENCKGRHPFAFIPFSGGIRNCIGSTHLPPHASSTSYADSLYTVNII
ncbi:cytochrome P450 4V2-like isoform X2 [Tachypleus tridentatus]|uniref:cytochrome P450 4V2-like isoform X2 n=1 Tax=Tachypleus tridentatus TaxID=6853 RepID=UPI003FD2F75D